MSSIVNTEQSSISFNNIKSHTIFGIFLTLVGLVFSIPKLTSYYNEYIADKKNNKFMKKNKIENIFMFAGLLFLIYGIREIFFKNMANPKLIAPL